MSPRSKQSHGCNMAISRLLLPSSQATQLYGDGNGTAPDTSPTAPRPKIGKRQRVEHLPPQPAPGEPVPAGHKQCRKCHVRVDINVCSMDAVCDFADVA